VARDRKRAKQRRDRRGSSAAGRARESAPAVLPGQPADPGSAADASAILPTKPAGVDAPAGLERANGDADLDAAAAARAGDAPAGSGTLSEGEIIAEAELEGDLKEDELQEPGRPSGPGGTGRGGSGTGGGGAGGGDGGVSPEQASGAPLRGGHRAIGFLRASWAELQRVQWPDRRQVTQATAVVLGFVAIAGLYLGLADYVAKEIVEFIL
jgi:preprotein translocase subunit SecE